jgi:mRNA interferase HigB
MHIITKNRLKEFWVKYPDSKTSLITWYKIAKKANWENPDDIRKIYNSVDFVDKFTIFDIGGNKYRLITFIDYKSRKIFIRHILSHKEYDKNKWKQDPWFK